MYKQVILVRTDLNLPKGKLAAQVAHASVESYVKTNKKCALLWRVKGAKKVVLKVKDEKELMEYNKLAAKEKISHSLITDAGKTVITPGTKTCLGIGPDKEEKIDKITGKLSMI